jgi:hypothetical protein
MPILIISHVFYDKYALASSNVQRHCHLAAPRAVRNRSRRGRTEPPALARARQSNKDAAERPRGIIRSCAMAQKSTILVTVIE